MVDAARCLLVFDDKTALERLTLLKSLTRKCVLFPLTINETLVDSVRLGLQDAGITVEATIPVTERLDQTAAEIRAPYVDFIDNLTDTPISGRLSIKEYFSHPSEDFSLWWLSVVFEKSNYKSQSLHRLVKLVTILRTCRILDIGSVVCAFPDSFLLEDLKKNQKQFDLHVHTLGLSKRFSFAKELFNHVIHAIYFCLSCFKRCLGVRRYRRNVRRLRKQDGAAPIIVVTYFPLIDKEAICRGRFVNKYFEPLQNALGAREKDQLVWLAMPVSIDGFTWKDSLSLGEKLVENGYRFYLIDEWLTVSQIFRAVWIYLYALLKFLLVVHKIKKECRFGEEKIKIWATLRSSWLASYCGFDLLQEALNYILFRACLRDISDAKMLTYLCENQAWEKAMCLAARDLPIAKIGIQHTSVPMFATRLFFFSAGKRPDLPTPDYLLCAGHIPATIHETFGFPPHRIVEWGAVRYQSLKALLPIDIAWEERENIIVVAGSILYNESRELLEWTHLALKGVEDVEVVLKAHPVQPYEPILNEFPEVRQRFRVSNQPITELLSKARALFVSSSTCALEGVASKVPVIVPRLISLVDMSPLRDVSDLPIYVDSVSKYREELRKLINAKSSPVDSDQCKQLVTDYFKFVESDEEFLLSLPMYDAVLSRDKEQGKPRKM